MSEARGTRYPAEWQRKAIWAAVSALAVSFLIFVFVAAIWIMANVISFLQPILIPVAIAAILAYLLDPVVTKMCARGLGRTKAVFALFAIFRQLALLVRHHPAPRHQVRDRPPLAAPRSRRTRSRTT